MCIVCGDIEDNGWNNEDHCRMVLCEHYNECFVKHLDEDRDECNSSYDVCTYCFNNLGYDIDEDYGSEDEYYVYPNYDKEPRKIYTESRKDYHERHRMLRETRQPLKDKRINLAKELKGQGLSRNVILEKLKEFDLENNFYYNND